MPNFQITQINMKNPKIIFIGGINGAGKSSIRDKHLDIDENSINIDPDKLSKQFKINGIGTDASNLQGGKEAIRLFEQAIKDRKNIVLETTLSGNSVFKRFDKAQQNGYQIDVLYMGLNSVDKHIDRVAHRVSVGGHHIDTDTIRKRFDLRDENLEKALLRSDNFTLFDNSNKEPKLSLEYSKETNTIYLLTKEKWVVDIAENISNKHNIRLMPITEEKKKELDNILQNLSQSNIKNQFPNLKSDDTPKIDLIKMQIISQYPSSFEAQKAGLEILKNQIPDIASGKITLPDFPDLDKGKGR